MNDIAERSIWLHKKSRHEYSVVTEAFNESNSERMVVYQSLTNGAVWVRPRAEFLIKFNPLHGSGDE
jgi:hypothetical protein